MGSIFENIVQYFNRKIGVYLLIVFGLLSFFYLGIKQLNIEDNLYSIFPKGEEFSEFNQIVKENKLNKQVFFSIATKEFSTEELEWKLDSVREILESKSEGLLGDFVVYRGENQSAVTDYFYRNYPIFIKDYSEIDSRIHPDSIRAAIDQSYDQLTSMSSFFVKDLVRRDPLGIAFKGLENLQPGRTDEGMFLEDGLLFSSDGSRVLMTSNINFELDDNVKNEKLNIILDRIKVDLNEQSELGFDFFGTFQISYENARQVKADTSLTLIISGILILMLLVFYYRSVLMPLFFLLPAVFAGVAGVGIVGFIQPNISAISLATSAVLLGIVLDYSFHFYTHFAETNDLGKTVRELSFPMLVGSFTTIAAFAALLFTDSVVLQNFGIIALSTLSSAALFTLLFLPTILKLTRFIPKSRIDKKRKKASKKLVRIGIYGILGLTIFFLFKANQFEFDADLNNLSYHTDDLVKKEKEFTGINPKEEKKIHLFVSGESELEVRRRNLALYNHLLDFRSRKGLEELVSIAPFNLPNQDVEVAFSKWNEYWSLKGDAVLESIQRESKMKGFSPKAFSPFEKWIKSDFRTEDANIVEELGLNHLIYETDKETRLVTSVVVNKASVDQLKKEVREFEGVFIFDVSEMTNSLLMSVQDDFNYLLVFSSLLVLISLIVVYGRLELALFAFLPMVISWIWILAIAGMFGLSFNFVNIIVATFIFGLGDDFSIFITDGLLKKYRDGDSSIQSYRSAILLSGITTIIGTGVLYFAKHPAVHSVALVSVIGIGCILLVTLIIQPYLFAFFITNRTKKKRSPMTLLGLVGSIGLFTYFFVGCVVLNVFLLVLLIVPVNKKSKRKLMNFLVSKLAKSTLYLGIHVKKDIVNPERLNFDKPSIIVANHSSFLDILLMIMLNPKVIIMVKKWVYNSPVFGFFIRYCGYLYVAEGTEYNLDLMRQRVDEGYSIMIFPEGTRSRDGVMKRFHKGAFYLAQELQLDIQPLLIIGANYVNPKNDLIIKSGSLIVWAMERISINDPLFRERFGVLTKEVQKRMREELKEVKRQNEDADYLKNRVIYNYLYKSPIVEWYVRIKWRFEKENFMFYDEILSNKYKIIDVGCGYGYLSYFLHYRDGDREILGVDYDDNKIALANHSYDKSDNLSFTSSDLREMSFEESDAILFNDVLHYVSFEEQQNALKRAVKSLRKGGVLIIRDGVTDLEERHAKTKKTERYSTQIIGFNKTSGDLSFFSVDDIYNFAKEHGLSCEMKEQSSTTSNVLFVLRN